ncbi:MAG: DUF3526 domain-containing protein [candidate division Zixibacteria bacterium]|nr:DUF3526 domain-containing protein [candidate division Zixibacteria bacterium]
MLWRIARKEFTELVRDGRFRWSAVFVLLLLMASVGMGWKNYREVSAQHRTAQEAMRAFWLNQGEKSPHSAAHYGLYAFKPRTPLSLVDQGVDAFTGVSVWLEAHKQNEFKFRPAQDATAVRRFGELTAAMALQLLMPLLIILLTFSSLAGEREQGVLRQLLSLGVRKRVLALGKALGVAGALGAILVPATVLGVMALALTDDTGALAGSWTRMALMGFLYLTYFAVFIVVSLAVSAQAASSRMALLILLGFWIVNGLLAPKAVTDIAKRLYPTPSAFAFATDVQKALANGVDGHNPRDKRNEALKVQTLKQYGVSRIEDLPVNFAGIALQADEEYGNEVFDRAYGTLWQTYTNQNAAYQLAGLVAPVLSVRALSMGLAGTDFEQHSHFASAAESYRRMLVKKMNDHMIDNAGKQDFAYMVNAEVWKTVPTFEYTLPDVRWVLGNQITSVLLIGVWAIAGIVALVVASNRIRTD